MTYRDTAGATFALRMIPATTFVRDSSAKLVKAVRVPVVVAPR